MTLDLLHADAVTDGEPVGLVTTGGTGSILHAVLAYREHAAPDRGHRPARTSIKPETAHPAFDKACHLFGIELRNAPVDPETTLVDVDCGGRPTSTTTRSPSSARPATTATAPSTRSTSSSDLALERGVGLHVDGCLGGFILPFGQELGYDIPVVRLPGARASRASRPTPTSTATAFKGTSVLAFRDKALRNGQYFFLTDWTGGKYCSPGIEGSRSGGLLAATWASMVHARPRGLPAATPSEIFETADAMQDAVAVAPRAADHGRRRRSASASRRDEFDIYHVNDFMRPTGWRFNGQQYPNAIHMAVTRPQTQPGVAEAFAADLAEAVAYAKRARATSRRRAARSTAASPAA